MNIGDLSPTEIVGLVKNMNAAKTNAERQREYRARQSARQATPVRGIFAHADDHAALKGHAVKMAKKRATIAKRLLASGVL